MRGRGPAGRIPGDQRLRQDDARRGGSRPLSRCRSSRRTRWCTAPGGPRRGDAELRELLRPTVEGAGVGARLRLPAQARHVRDGARRHRRLARPAAVGLPEPPVPAHVRRASARGEELWNGNRESWRARVRGLGLAVRLRRSASTSPSAASCRELLRAPRARPRRGRAAAHARGGRGLGGVEVAARRAPARPRRRGRRRRGRRRRAPPCRGRRRAPSRCASASSAWRSASTRASRTAPARATRASVGSTSSRAAPRAITPATAGSRPRAEDQRQGDRAVEEIGAERLAGGVGTPVAVEDVVGDLERQAERRGELAQTGRPRRRAGRRSAPPSIAAAANRRPVLSRQRSRYCSGVVCRVAGLLALQDLAAGEREAGVGEGRDRVHVARRARARRTRARTGSRRSRGRPPRRARPRPSAGRAAAARRRAGRRGRASPCARARPRSRPRRGPGRSRPPTGADRYTSIGRRRLPPERSVSAPAPATAVRRPSRRPPRAPPRPRRRRPRGPGRAAPRRRRPLSCRDRTNMHRHRAAREPPVAHAAQAGPAHDRGQLVGRREAVHRRGQVAVGVGLAGDEPSQQRHRPVGPEARERAPPTPAGRSARGTRPARRGATTRRSSANPRSVVGQVAHAEADGGGGELAVGERQRERVAAHPLDLRAACARRRRASPGRSRGRRRGRAARPRRGARSRGRRCRSTRRAPRRRAPRRSQRTATAAPAPVHAEAHDPVHAVVRRARCGRTSPAPDRAGGSLATPRAASGRASTPAAASTRPATKSTMSAIVLGQVVEAGHRRDDRGAGPLAAAAGSRGGSPRAASRAARARAGGPPSAARPPPGGSGSTRCRRRSCRRSPSSTGTRSRRRCARCRTRTGAE